MSFEKVDEFTYGQESPRENLETQSEEEKAPPKMQGISASSGQKRHAISASDPIGPQAASDLEFCQGRKRKESSPFFHLFCQSWARTCRFVVTSISCPVRRQHGISLEDKQCCDHTSQQVGRMVLYASESLLESDRVNLPSRGTST